MSPPPGAAGPRRKWFWATSIKVAPDANEEMWPPMLSEVRLARTTIAMAFQRMIDLMRRSISRRPGSTGWWARGMVFTYGVLAVKGSSAPRWWA